MANDIDWNNVLKYMMLSGVAGTSIASLAGLKRLIDTQSYYDKGPTNWDDDTMYVMKKNASNDKEEGMNGYTMGALLAGVPLAFGGGFALTNYLFNKYMRHEAQKELDKSQLVFVNNSGYDNIKKASMQKQAESNLDWLFNTAKDTLAVDKPLGLGLGAGLLVALASGFASHQYLQSSWPTKKPKVLAKPKKIKVVDSLDELPGGNPYASESAESGEDIAGLDKQSNYDDMDLVARMLCNMDKEASVASQVVHACALGRAEEFEKAVEDVGFMNAVNLIKGASSVPVNPIAKELAVTYCTKVASFADPFRLAVAAEYQALHPEICKSASQASPECAMFLNAFANDFGAAVLKDFAVELGADESLNKSASYDDMFIADAFKSVLVKLAASPVVDNSDMQSSETSSGNIEQNSYKSKEDIHNESLKYKQAQNTGFRQVQDDIIDQVMLSAEKPNISDSSLEDDVAQDSILQNV